MRIELEKKEVIVTYVYRQPTGVPSPREAIVTFIDGVFKGCRFSLSTNSNYNYVDWMFLKEVAKKIEYLKNTGSTK